MEAKEQLVEITEYFERDAESPHGIPRTNHFDHHVPHLIPRRELVCRDGHVLSIDLQRLSCSGVITRTYLKIVDSMNMLKYRYVHAAAARRPMGTDSGTFSGGTHPRRAPWAQAGPHTCGPGSGVVDSEHGGAMAPAPQCYPHDKTVHRRFQQWCAREVLREI